ncbi:MAG: hypothetical protein K8963_09030 [Proteobacteria bacterium]|nr:hypothetical protein [Pseudomonadota bacterium]
MNLQKTRQGPAVAFIRLWLVWACVTYSATPIAEDKLVGTNKHHPSTKAESESHLAAPKSAHKPAKPDASSKTIITSSTTDPGREAEADVDASVGEDVGVGGEAEAGVGAAVGAGDSVGADLGREAEAGVDAGVGEDVGVGGEVDVGVGAGVGGDVGVGGEVDVGVGAGVGGDVGVGGDAGGGVDAGVDAGGVVGRGVAVGETLMLRPYVAEYYVRVRGYDAGLLTVVMSQTDDGWLRQNIAIASGLATLFTNTVLEDSRFRLGADGNIVPQSYYLRNRAVSQWVKVDYSDAGAGMSAEFFNIRKIDDGVVKHKADGARLLDDALWMVQAAIDYLGGQLPQRYDIVGISGIRAHGLAFERREDYQIGDVSYPCVVLKRSRLGKDNDHVLLRLAENHGYVPVSMERYKKGKRLFQLKLSVVAFD